MMDNREEASTSSAMAKTTTISTIAVQSGRTRIVIALLHCGDWINLKIVEITPELTSLGENLAEAMELQKAHDEVLRQLKNKQSPVEELLRQADQLIATQRPRAEVYAAMAESLGRAWKDINSLLELRKEILDLNVQYHTRAQEFFSRTDELEAQCADTVVPIEINAVKQFLNMIHDLRRGILESLMGALQAGNSLLGNLKELGAEGTLDSRPDRIRTSVNRAISQVQGWMEQLHLKRQTLEITFTRRKTQLEQCLALAMLAADLRELEDTISGRRELLQCTDQLGDSAASAELLLHEHNKLLPEAQQLQERALKITKATEQLLTSGCFAGEQATEQAYKILSSTSDYLSELQLRENLLERAIAFFKNAQSVLDKLDQLEFQLTSTELAATSPQLAHLHAQCAGAIEQATAAPIAEGHSILEAVGTRPGSEGVKRTVEDLENKKIALDRLCIAHKEENRRINMVLNNFFDKHHEILCWLVDVAEAFLEKTRDMGIDTVGAKDFSDLHNQLLNDLQTKGNEINALLLTVPPILEYLEDNQRRDVDDKVGELSNRWMKLKTILENRLDLARIYVKFQMEVDIVNQEMDRLEQSLLQNKDNISDDILQQLEEKWESLLPLYQSAKNTGLTFIDQANKVSEAYLDTKRACLCVESVLERLAGRQLLVTRNWQSYHTEVVEKREILIRLEQTMAESTKTINWVTKLDEQLYPVITSNSTSPQEISTMLKNKLEKVLPDINKAQNEVDIRIRTAEALIDKSQSTDEKTQTVRNKLSELREKLNEKATDYRVLLELLIDYFNNLIELDSTAERLNQKVNEVRLDSIEKVESAVREHESAKQAVLELYKQAQNECERISQKIAKQEPPQAAESDIEKLQHILELQKDHWEKRWKKKRDYLESDRQLSQFDADLKEINHTLDELAHQLQDVKGKYGESLASAKATSQAFVYFEETVELLEQRIKAFVDTGEKLLANEHAEGPHIQQQISQLQDRWNNFKNQVRHTRDLINLSLAYFDLVDQANDWFKEGNRLLVNIAKKSALVKTPGEAQQLLDEITVFLKPGEDKQNERIHKIMELAAEIYDHPTQVHSVVLDNQGMLDSFTSISQEINSLAEHLKFAEQQRLKEFEEAKIRAEEEARKRADEEARRLAEEEARRRAEEEARRIAEEDAKRKAREAELRAEQEAKRLAEEAKRRAEDEARRLLEEEAKRRAEEEARRRDEEAKRQAEEEARRQAEEVKRRDEEEARRRAEEVKLRAEEEAKRQAEAAKLRAEEEAKRQVEAAKQRAEEEARLKAIEERRLAEEARLRAAQQAREIAEVELIALEAQKAEVARLESLHKPQANGVAVENLETPRFTSPLSDAVIQEGSKFTFLCQVTGYPIPIVTWFKDNISIQNNPDYQTTFDQGLCALTIEETFAEDSAKYTCKAVNAAGAAETGALLSVKESEPEEQLAPPSFVKMLESSIAREGTSFQFHCKVEGNPLPTVQWFRNNECIDNSPDYGITYNNGDAILRFDKINLGDKADFTCKAANELGVAQSTANLNVTPLEPVEAPKFLQPLSNVMARAGQKIKLECEVSGLPPPILTWSHNGKPVKETREIKLHQEGNKATLIVLEAFPKDAGTYVVTANNIAGEITSSSGVSVKGRLPTETSDSELASDMEPIKPSIQLPLTNITVNEGNRVRLDCVIVGQPEPEVIWYHDDRPVKESPDFQLLFQGDRCSLVIQEAFAEDGGQYKVVALNSAGEASSQCLLTVAPSTETKPPEEKPEAGSSPKFTKLLADILVSEGDRVLFEGNVVGEPKPEVTWLLNNQLINASEHIRISHEDDGNIRLEIEEVRPEDKGVYTVKVANALGDAKCFAQLIVKSAKPTETVKHEEVKSAPVFKQSFQDRAAFNNTSTKFECLIVGKPAPKVRWLFNNEPISGKQMLISTSGDRQVLTIPDVTKDLEGTITCVAENEVGKASCSAGLTVQSTDAITLPELSRDLHQHIESSYFLNREVRTETSTSSTSKIITSEKQQEPHVEIHSYKAENQQTYKQINQEPPLISESHKIEEYTQVDQKPPVIHEKSTSTSTTGAIESQVQIIQKPAIKMRAARFVTPVIGKIVDQNADVVLEGILDGQPTPQVTWTKNNQPLIETENLKIHFEHNRTTVTIKNANTEDAGRYTCTAINEAGKAISTADLVVRKTVFPPVFGRRLQAQVIKKGDRVVMEVEVTGTPVPTVTWYKDGVPIEQALGKERVTIRSIGNSHAVVVEKATLDLTGRFMVRAVNSGGEAQSIADIAVFEPTPDTMVEVVKTVVYEDVRKHETLTSAADKVISTVSSQATPPPPPKPSRSEFSSEVSTSQQQISKEYKSYQYDHSASSVPQPTPAVVKRETDFQICRPESTQELTEEKKYQSEETGIETSSISKQSSLQYFVKKIKQEEDGGASLKEITIPEPIKPEIYRKFEDVPQEIPIPVRVETKPAELPQYKPFTHPEPAVQEMRTFTREERTIEPEPPAEICYAPSVSRAQEKVNVIEERSFSERSEKSFSQFTSDQIQRPFSSLSSSIEREHVQRPLSAQSGFVEPSPEALQMEKAWAHSFTDGHIEKSRPQHENKSSYSVQSTLEKKWTPQVKTSEYRESRTSQSVPITQFYKETKTVVEAPSVVTHYIGKVTDVQHNAFLQSTYESSQEETIERNVRPSEVIKSWPPAPPIKPVPSIDSLSIRPVSVQDITDEVYLEPGPPPEIGFAQPPPKERRQSYVEMVEHDLEKNLERLPAKVPPGGVRTIPPPPLPPKKEQAKAPPLPAKPVKVKPVPSLPFERFPELEPFPFRAEPEQPRPLRVGPPPTPSKFIKGRFTDSDYESDFEAVRIPPKWKPCSSDTEEPSYRRVRAPQYIQTGRSRSMEPEPLPPSKFDHPPHFQGPPRPDIDLEAERRKRELKKQAKHVTKTQRGAYAPPPQEVQPFHIEIKPGSPPVFLESERKPRVESPKIKQRVVDGYMADTDEPFSQQKKIIKEYRFEEKSEYRHSESEHKFESEQRVGAKPHIPHKVPFHKKHVSTSVSTAQKELVATPIVTSVSTQEITQHQEQFPFKPDPPRGKKPRGPPPPSPSKFVKGEFRESDYESDYEGRIPPVWRPTDSDGGPSYKPVKPILAPASQHSAQHVQIPTPPTLFDHPPQIHGPPRPKFEPIEKFKSVKPTPPSSVLKPKALSAVAVIDQPISLQPGSPPELGYAPRRTQYYKSTTSTPYHNAVQTETSNVMNFNESTENCHRHVSLQQTTKVIKFGDRTQREEHSLEHFPCQPDSQRPVRRVPPPPTPTKFVPGEFRESDYESEVEGTRIRAKWTPGGGDGDYYYKPVKAPMTRATSVPASKERVITPMEFEQQPPVLPSVKITDITDGEYKHDTRITSRSRSYEPPAVQPATPPEYGYSGKYTKSSASKLASHHMDSMTQAFKSKTQKFMGDVMGDVNRQPQKPLEREDGDAQVYREESRAAQYGTKHVDPDTGLIYFKYDFGYEFGIILPGESKQGGIPVPKKTIIEPPKRTQDIEMPVYHESSTKPGVSPQFKPKKFTKNVKWEPTSESEMSEYEGDKRHLPGTRWEPSSCSPVSLSPSLPSTSPAFNNTLAGRKETETPPSCPSTPGSVGKNLINAGQGRAPMFITPLRDIAVVSGQAAKFECIVQSEPPPNIIWSKNGRIIENSNVYELHYRNGVCRLTISQAYPEDAGTYTCTATNQIGTVNTTATLQVPGERRSTYLK